jgi:GGDEF domain-containing protein
VIADEERTLARAALRSADPLADPLFPTSLVGSQCQRFGSDVDSIPLLVAWSERHTGGSSLRYPWEISTRHMRHWPSYVGPREGWRPWRAGDIAALVEEGPRVFEDRFLIPLILADTFEFLASNAEKAGPAGDLARSLLEPARSAIRRDAAPYTRETHAWGDTWALWCFARRPHMLRFLYPYALAIADAYAEATWRNGGREVLGTGYPFHGVPLVSASAQLASGLAGLGYHPQLLANLTGYVAAQQDVRGGWGDSSGPPDVLTTFVAAELLAGLDPGYDPAPTIAFLTRCQRPEGWWTAYGPETAWLTTEIEAWLQRAGLPFPARFRWPQMILAQRDRRTGLPLYGYYADLAALCRALPGLAASGVELAFLDLVGFREVNNRLGMAAGDEVLVAFANALAAIPEAMAVRDGGDEFLVLGPPGGRGLARKMEDFRHSWPAVYHARFGADAPAVVPRILVAQTEGRHLIWLRDDLGRRVGDLKHQFRDVGATGVQVDLGMQWPGAAVTTSDGAGRLPPDAVSSSAAPTRYVEGTVLVPLQAHPIESLEVQKVVVVGGRAYFGSGANHRELLHLAGLDPSTVDTTGLAYFAPKWSLAGEAETQASGEDTSTKGGEADDRGT